MNGETLSKWIKERALRPEKAAAILDISLSTLQNGLRGARWSEETQEKIKQAMAAFDAQKKLDSPPAA